MADPPDDTPTSVGDPAEAAAPGHDDNATASRDATPSVVAVIVAHEPGDWFEQTLESLATQDYPRLQVVVIDGAGEADLSSRVEAVLPSASVVDAADTVGFGAAANAILDTDIDPAFLLFCHDDVALAPDAVRLLVVEALRSNAGICGPKLVDWDNPDQLQHVAYSVDRFAVSADVIDPGELDQEQFDAVADVFAVPSACLMVRTTLFRTIGGFDAVIDFRGDDVDLCWRAQLAGARVMVVPDARVRHREDLLSRTGVDDVRRTRARHQLRTVLVTGSRVSLFFTLPLIALLTLGEAAIALVTGRMSQVADVLTAWTWNASRLSDIRERRAALRPIVKAQHRDVRALQQTGSVRINAFVRGQIGRGDGFGGARREFISAMRMGTARISAVVWGLLALYLLFGSRSLFSDGVAAVGDFAPFPDSAGDLISDWWGGWRDRDLGAAGPTPTGVAVLGVLAALPGISIGLARTLWILGPIVVGLIGAWRMLAVSGSRRAQLGTLLTYAVVPLPWASVATGSIAGLYAYGAAPWVLACLLHVQAASPYRTATGPWRSLVAAATGAGMALGIAMLFEPSVILILVPIIAGLLLSGILSAHPAGTGRLVGSLPVVGGVIAILALPLVLDLVVNAPTWEPFADGRGGEASHHTLADLLRFVVGPVDPGPLLWALAVPLAVPLVVGQSWRFGLAVRGWSVALCSWGLAWAAAWGVLPFGLPDMALLLAPAAAAVALIAGASVASFEHDLRRSGFGWRQALLPVSVLAAALALMPSLGRIQTGRWDLPRGDFETVLPFADPVDDGSYRVLWVGAPELLPGGGRHLEGNLAWTASFDGIPDISERLPSADNGASGLVEDALIKAFDGETMRLGRVLGGLGIRYVVLLERLAPAPFSNESQAVAVPDVVADAMAAQLDLRRIEGINTAMEIYANTQWVSVRAAAPPGFDDERSTVSDLAGSPLAGTAGVLPGIGDRIVGLIPEGAEILVAQSSDSRWRLEVDGENAAKRRSLGWATVYLPQQGGTAELIYAKPWWRSVVLVVQVGTLLGLLGLLLRRRVGSEE